jgi:hypothetical protein
MNHILATGRWQCLGMTLKTFKGELQALGSYSPSLGGMM